MTTSQNAFLKEVAFHLELPLDHPLYKGLAGIPEINKPDYPEVDNPYDYWSSSFVGTPYDNDNHYLELQIYELFRKADFSLDGVDPHENAVKDFMGQMDTSAENNRRLTSILGVPDDSHLWDNANFATFNRMLRFARHFCHVLTDYAVNDIRSNGIVPRFTSGACQGSKKSIPTGNSVVERFHGACVSERVAPVLKAIGEAEINRLLSAQIFFLKEDFENGWSIYCKYTRFELPFWSLFSNRARVVDKVTLANFVPKTFKTLRPTFSECVGDIAIQCGIGDALVRSLAFNGYDVRTLPDLHKKIVQGGSVTGHIATFDMKGGSENVYLALGEYMLPKPIYELCIHSRTDQVEIDGKRYSYPNMATAGNGFCFPLETIIFLSLQMAVCAHSGLKPRIVRKTQENGLSVRKIVKNGYHNVCSTFGDDVIIPARFSLSFIEFFSKLGIVLNLDKSYWTGHFRESCGAHSLNGRDINCFNAKTVPTMENANEIKKFLNGIRRFCYDNNHGRWRHPRLRSLWFGILGSSQGTYEGRLGSPDSTINHGANGDAGVLVPRTYSVTRYVTHLAGPVLPVPMRERAVSSDLSLKIVHHTRKEESYRMYRIRSVAAAGGFPIVTQKFYVAKFADKISLSKLLRENPIPSLPLLKIVGQGLLSGAGLVHPTSLTDWSEPHVGEEKEGELSISTYPEFFVRNRLKIVHASQTADPSAFSNEEVDDLFNRIGQSFERTRISRYHRELLSERRLNVWEKRRASSLKSVLNLLKARASSIENDLDQLFS